MSNLRYELKHRARNGVSDKDTIKNYVSAIDKFCQWASARGINKRSDIPKGKSIDLINDYSDYLQNEGYAAGTVHTYLAPICKGLQVKMCQIKKPRRSARTISKRRVDKSNLQGKREMTQERFDRSVRLSKATGARRAELKKLTYEDLDQKDESGHRCVAIRGGKGGKDTLQRLTPEQEKIIDDFLENARASGIDPSERVLTSKELQNHIDYHSIRAERAMNAYDGYVERIEKEGMRPLIDELVNRWNETHEEKDQIVLGTNGKYEITEQSMAKHFYRSLAQSKKPYKLRGDNRVRAQNEGRPVEYDRLALLATSVFELSHWRIDVTMTNYML